MLVSVVPTAKTVIALAKIANAAIVVRKNKKHAVAKTAASAVPDVKTATAPAAASVNAAVAARRSSYQ